MSLNTEIVGDPQGCRQYGGWLRSLGDGALDTSDLLAQVSAHSDFCWDDHVGDLFRLQMDSGKRDASALYDAISRVGDAVNGFADDLATAIATMREARTVASNGGVLVTATTIEPPSMPEHLTGITASHRVVEIVGQSEASHAYQTQLAAYQDAEWIVGRARAQEQEAHDTLARRVEERRHELEEIRRASRFLPLVEVAVGGPASTFAQASTWTRLAQRYQDHADAARRIWDDPFRTQAARTAALNEFLLNQGRAAQAGRAAEAIHPGSMLRGLQRSRVGRHMLEGMAVNGRAAAGGVPVPRAANGVLRSIPAATVLGAGAGVALDVAAGEPPEQAVVSNAAAVTVGAGTTTLLLGSAVAGPAGVGAVAAGIGMAWLADFTVDQIMSE